MYYCQSRYYVPEWCRWLNADDTAYLSTETIDGLNLFVYCGNNPVMHKDPSGHFVTFAAAIAAIVAGAIIGAFYGYITALANGQNVLAGALIGAASGALMGLTTLVGSYIIGLAFASIALAGTVSISSTLVIVGGAAIGFAGGFIAGMLADVSLQAINNENHYVDLISAALVGVEWGVINMLSSFAGSYVGVIKGFFSNLIVNTALNINFGGIGFCIDVIKEYIGNKKPSSDQAKNVNKMLFEY
jgi:hypothetical protein